MTKKKVKSGTIEVKDLVRAALRQNVGRDKGMIVSDRTKGVALLTQSTDTVLTHDQFAERDAHN